jgi:hypothetical protein
MRLDKKPQLSKRRRKQIVELWSRISEGEIADIDQALAAIPIEKDDSEYIIVRAVMSLFLERGPTLLGNFDIYSEMAHLFTEVILENTPPGVVSLMHIAAIPPRFSLPLLTHLVDRPEEKVRPYFDQLVHCRVIRSDGKGNYWFPPTFKDCLLLHWFRPENRAGYVHVERRLKLWTVGAAGGHESKGDTPLLEGRR